MFPFKKQTPKPEIKPNIPIGIISDFFELYILSKHVKEQKEALDDLTNKRIASQSEITKKITDIDYCSKILSTIHPSATNAISILLSDIAEIDDFLISLRERLSLASRKEILAITEFETLKTKIKEHYIEYNISFPKYSPMKSEYLGYELSGESIYYNHKYEKEIDNITNHTRPITLESILSKL